MKTISNPVALIIFLTFSILTTAQSNDFWIGSWVVDKEGSLSALPKEISAFETTLISKLLDQFASEKVEFVFSKNALYIIKNGIGTYEPFNDITLNGEHWLRTADKIYRVKNTANGMLYPMETDSGATLWLNLTSKE